MPSSISPAETEILRLIWQLESATVQEVCNALPKERSIANATVQTMLRRLEKKGYVRHRSKGKAHVFYAAVKPEKVVERTVVDFVDRLFGGDPLPLMLHLADHSEMKPEDIERLKKLIRKHAQ